MRGLDRQQVSVTPLDEYTTQKLAPQTALQVKNRLYSLHMPECIIEDATITVVFFFVVFLKGLNSALIKKAE